MNSIDTSQILAHIRSFQAEIHATPVVPPSGPVGGGFGVALQRAVDEVNHAQQRAGQLAAAFERHEAGSSWPR